MNKHKILSILTLLVVSATMSLAAFDFGLELTNSAGVNYITEANIYTDHKGTLWLSIPFDNNKTNSLSIEGSAYAAKPAGTDSFSVFADLDLFRLTVVPFSGATSKISVDAGRIPVGDVTGFVLSQSADGMEMHGTFGFGNIDFLAGYTGLLNVRKGGALMTTDDSADASTDAIYGFGSKRLLGKVTVQLTQLIGSMDLIAEAVGQYDMREKTATSETVDTAYATISVSGPALNILYYSASGTFQTGAMRKNKTSYSENSAIASLRFDLFPAAGNQLYIQGVFSPGEDDFFSSFLPITFQGAGTLYSGGYGNLLRASAGWYFNPVSMLNIDLGGKVFMHLKKTEAAPDLYDSSEISLGATIKATTDLRFRIDSAIILPNNGDNQSQVSLKAILDI